MPLLFIATIILFVHGRPVSRPVCLPAEIRDLARQPFSEVKNSRKNKKNSELLG